MSNSEILTAPYWYSFYQELYNAVAHVNDKPDGVGVCQFYLCTEVGFLPDQIDIPGYCAVINGVTLFLFQRSEICIVK